MELGDSTTAVLLAREAAARQTPDGRLGVVATSDSSPCDAAANGEPVLFAARTTGDPALQAAADRMLHHLLFDAPRTPDGILFQLADKRQVWDDFVYMVPPFLAAAGHPDEAMRQIRGCRQRLWNAEEQLYSHMWDEDARTIVRPDFWGVGIGWVAAGLTRVIPALPRDMEAERQECIHHLREVLTGCLSHGRPDGLFHYIVDRPDTFVETNLSQMLAYAIFRGVAGGWLPRGLLDPAHRMRRAAHARVDDEGWVLGVCAPPNFDHPGIAPEGQALFLLMEAAAGQCEER